MRREVTPEYLESAIKFFAARNYEIISLDKLFQVLHGNKINKKFIVFTFDDGYADNFTYAYQIFKKYNIPFAIYVTTNFPDRQAILWEDLLEDLILQNNRLLIEVDNKTLEFNCSSWVKKENTFVEICSVIKNVRENNYHTQIKKIFAPYKIDIYEKTDQLALSWSQIKQLKSDPLVTIGAHSVNHYVLSKLSETASRYEIMESKKKIESQINCSVEHFAYPYGTRSEIGIRELIIIRECGFKTATTAISGNIFFAHKNYIECLPRVPISGEREVKNIRYLNLRINGTISCLTNKFKRVVTL